MQDGQLCLLSPGEVVDIFGFKGGKTKRGEKTIWVKCGASRVEEGEGGPERLALFFFYRTLPNS